MYIRKIILICTVIFIWLNADIYYGGQGGLAKEISAEQKEKAHAILKQALVIVEKEEDVVNNEFSLASISAVLARLDVDEALAVIDKMGKDSVVPVLALGMILPEVAKADKERVMVIFDSIIDIIDQMGRPADGSDDGLILPLFGISALLPPMISAIAKTDVELALAVADKLKGDEFKEGMRLLVLVHIAGVTAKKDTDKALAIASGIDGSAKSLALIYVAGEIAENDTERAQAILDKALLPLDDEAEFLFDEIWMFDVPGALAKVNPDKAISLAASIKMEEEKTKVLTRIVTEIAKTNPSKALEIAHREAYAPAKAQMLIQIGVVIAKKDADKALTIADEIANMKYIQAEVKAERAALISAAAVEITQSDQQRGLALLEQALTVADMAKYVGERHTLLVASMTAQIDADMAIKMAEKIDNPVQRGMILNSIATAIAQTEPDKALMIAEKIAENSLKAGTLCNIAAAILGVEIQSMNVMEGMIR